MPEFLSKTCIPLLALVILQNCFPRIAADQIEHPAWVNWSKFPVGTRVTMRSVTKIKGMVSSTVETTTVLMKKDDKAVVIRKSFAVAGEPKPNPDDFVETTIKRYFPLLPGADPSKVGKPAGIAEAGTEKFDLLGKTYETEWYESRATTEAGPATTRTWISQEMPGQIVRSLTEVKAAGKSTVDEVIEIDLPVPN
ncbi:hypothetical protein GC170_10450 [bacterium]|nr:hypothetical protein [bacterium]